MFDTTERHRAQEALRRSELARHEVLEAMLHSEAAARAQIAGELHDDTIQVMTAALMAVERVTIAAVDTDRRVADALQDARATLRTAVERARRLTFELRPPLLDAQGIGAALRDLADEVGQEGGFAVALTAPEGRFTYLVEDLAFRTVKEALVNARKHSQASRVEVRLWSDEAWLRGCVARRRARIRRHPRSRSQRHAAAPGPGRDVRAAAAGRGRCQHLLVAGQGRARRFRDPAGAVRGLTYRGPAGTAGIIGRDELDPVRLRP